jgi:adhesin/invasin
MRRRWASAAVVVGAVSAVLASPLSLGTSSAAPPPPTVTSVTISSTTNGPAGGNATINGTYSPAAGVGGTAPSIEYTITGSTPPTAAAPTFPAGTACGTVNLDGTFTCTVHNGGTAGTEHVTVFADNNTNNTYNPPNEPSAPADLVFSGAPATINFTSAPATAATDTCTPYSATVKDANGNGAAGQTVVLTVTENATSTPAANPITLYNADCSTVVDNGGTATGNTITYSYNLTVEGNDNNGTVAFGLATSAPGTATIKLANTANTVSDQASTAFTQGDTNSAAHLAVTSTNPTTQYTGSTANFTVKATDTVGNPLQGVTVMEETTGGPDTLAPTACGTTSFNGTVTCPIHNGGTAGTDQLTFWVNNCTTTCTTGPDNGEPQTNASAVFKQQPAVSQTNSTVTCTQQLSGAQQGKQVAICTVPTSQHSVVFTATVKDASGNPISGAVVNFTTTAAKLGGATPGTLPSGTATTDANGNAPFTVNDPNAQGGDFATVQATVGNVSIGNATAHWASPTASTLTLTPPVQSVTKGGTVTVKAQVTDQFGAPMSSPPVIHYTVAGRNNGVTGVAAPDGTITYQDTGINSSSNTDTITATDTVDNLTGTATVDYITGSTTASSVKVDTSGHVVAGMDSTCGATSTSATDVPLGSTTTVCALVKNASGEVLANKTVTFTVSDGQVDATGWLSSSSTKTYQATTDGGGVAFADVTSTTSGTQTVTAAADAASDRGTITYASPEVTDAYAITLSPTGVTVTPGGQQKFTATVKDKFGNPVSGVALSYTQSGPGSINGSSSGTLTTDANGSASVTLTTAASDTGNGSVTVTITTPGTACSNAPSGTPPSSCTATSTYTVSKTPTPSSVTVTPEQGVTAGGNEFVGAKVLNSDGTPAANQVVRFTVSGANSASGSATTKSNGIAVFGYVARNAGTDVVNAYDDVNNNGVRDTGEPSGSAGVTIASTHHPVEHPAIHLTSRHGHVTIHVTTHPSLSGDKVTYFVKVRGHWRKIGTRLTNGHGGSALTLRARRGARLTFRVHVSGAAGVRGGTSPARSNRVR